MRFLDRLERKAGWLSFPGFLRFYAMLHFAVFMIQIVRPGVWKVLEFDLPLILSGQVWRLVTFLFSNSGMLGAHPMTIVFFIFGMFLMFTISDMLEGAWGGFRTSLFYFVGWLSLVGANILFGGVPLGGLAFYASVFFAFATLFPKFELRLMFILPVPVWLLAVIQAGALLVLAIGAPILLLFFGIAFLNYFLWSGVPALKGQARVMQSSQRRRSFDAKKLSKEEAFHRCASCGRTENSDPSLEFRIGADGEEYCDDHLPG